MRQFYLHYAAVVEEIPSKDCAAGQKEVRLRGVSLIQFLAGAQDLGARFFVQEQEGMVWKAVDWQPFWLKIHSPHAVHTCAHAPFINSKPPKHAHLILNEPSEHAHHNIIKILW